MSHIFQRCSVHCFLAQKHPGELFSPVEESSCFCAAWLLLLHVPGMGKHLCLQIATIAAVEWLPRSGSDMNSLACPVSPTSSCLPRKPEVKPEFIPQGHQHGSFPWSASLPQRVCIQNSGPDCQDKKSIYHLEWLRFTQQLLCLQTQGWLLLLYPLWVRIVQILGTKA